MVLEEFEEFAKIPGQNLLYTLFEASSNLKLPVLIIGVTEKYDVVGMLEKRVKSRFSQYVIAVTGSSFGFDEYMQAVKASLCPAGSPKGYADKINAVFKDKKVLHALNACYLQSPSIHYALSRLVLIFPEKVTDRPRINAAEVADALASGRGSSLEAVLSDASEPMMLLLVALSRFLAKTHGQSPVTFEAVKEEFKQMMQQADKNQVGAAFSISSETLQLAWNSLEDLGIVARPWNSFINSQLDQASVSEPLTNIFDSLPDGCPAYLQTLSSFS